MLSTEYKIINIDRWCTPFISIYINKSIDQTYKIYTLHSGPSIMFVDETGHYIYDAENMIFPCILICVYFAERTLDTIRPNFNIQPLSINTDQHIYLMDRKGGMTKAAVKILDNK